MLEDAKIPVRFKLSALWASLMFCYAYGDYFGLYVPDKLSDMLKGVGPLGPVSEQTLVAVSVLMIIPSLMVFLPLALPPRVARWLNIALAIIYAVVVALTVPGAWLFYRLFSGVEIVLSAGIVWCAWTWPRTAAN